MSQLRRFWHNYKNGPLRRNKQRQKNNELLEKTHCSASVLVLSEYEGPELAEEELALGRWRSLPQPSFSDVDPTEGHEAVRTH
ncbi:hypothetical protein AOLI_G00236540 [Acnodon oligacanthus]